MNKTLFNSIAFDIAKNPLTTDLERFDLLIAIEKKDIDKLVSIAKETNTKVTLYEYLQLLEPQTSMEQNKFIAQYLNIKGVTCTPIEVDRYNETIRVALMREASFVCNEEIANDSIS